MFLAPVASIGANFIWLQSTKGHQLNLKWSQLLAKMFKKKFSQRFGKNISNLILGVYILQFYFLVTNLFSKEMVFDAYVLHFLVEDRIFRNTYCTSVITQYWNGIIVS